MALGEDIPAYFSNDEDVAKKIDTLNQKKFAHGDFLFFTLIRINSTLKMQIYVMLLWMVWQDQ